MASVARYKFVPSMIHEQDDVFLQVLDEDTVLTGLQNETNPKTRTSILESLRMSVRRNGGQLFIQERFSLFNAINNVLLDNDVNTRLAGLNLVCEMIPDFGSALDECMALILPQLVVFIGHNNISLKKLALQTLHVYMTHSEHLENALNAIIQVGLESENMDTQMESLIALPILITPNFADEDLFPLTEALVRRIAGNSSVHADTASLAMNSVEQIKKVVGQRNFEKYVQKLEPRLQTVLNRAMKAISNDNDRSKSRKSKSAGVPTEDIKVDNRKLDRGLTIAGINSDKLVNGKSETEYLPPRIMAKLKDADWRTKEEGIEELHTWLNNDVNLICLLPHLDHFLGILRELLNDSNFKVNLSCLQLFGVIIDKLGTRLEPVLELLVNVLGSKLGDNKNVMKQTNMQVFKNLMQNFSPKRILRFLKGHIKHRNSRVREETLNVIIASLLTFPSNKFDLTQLTSDVAPALTDPKSRVRHAALEAFAVISQVMGPNNLKPLVSTVNEIELNMGGDGVMAAVQARFARRQLPKLNSDGLVEYAVPLPSSGSAKVNANLSPRGADVEWILAAGVSSDCPSSARSTPGLNDPTVASPRRHLSAGKSRLPWESGKGTVEANEEHPQKQKSSWVFEEHHDQPPGKQDQPHSSYAVKYNARKTSVNPTNPAEPSNPVTSYAQLHKSKSAKTQTFSTRPVKSNSLGPIANGYALIYKKGSLGNRTTQGFDNNNNVNKPYVRNNSIGAKSLSPFDSHLQKSPIARRKTDNMIDLKNNASLSASLPDWSELSNRQRKLLSPVSSGLNRDDDHSSLSNASTYNDSPIQTKPTLVRSASKKGRVLKSIDFSDASASLKVSSATSPTIHPPARPKEQLHDSYQHKNAIGRNRSPFSSDTEDGPARYHKPLSGNRTWSAGSRKYDEDVLPFDTKPRIARTPVHVRNQSSSDSTITADSPRDIPEVNRHTARDNYELSRDRHVTSHKTVTEENVADESDVKKRKSMEIIGHAFDSPEKKSNKAMQSTLGSTSGIGSSLEESGELKAGIDRLVSDRDPDATRVEDFDDYELDYEDDSDSEDDPSTSDDRLLKDGKLLKDYERHVDRLDQDDTYSDTMDDDGSDGESLEDSEGYEESDEDDDEAYRKRSSSTEEYSNSRSERQSLSKSTRERMERERERQRNEELERQREREKLAKEQRELENLIKRKEKEKEKERLKRERLSQQLKKREEIAQEEFLKSKSHLDDLESDVKRQRERADTLKKIQLKKEANEMKVKASLASEINGDHVRDLTVQGHHAPSVPSPAVNKHAPAVPGAAMNKTEPSVSSTAASKPTPSAATAITNKPPVSSPKKKSANLNLSNHSVQPQETPSDLSKQPAQGKYVWDVHESDLKPFSSGDAAIKTILKLLEDPDWEAKCEGLLCIRRLIRHHVPDAVQHLHVLILAVVAEVKNLRSQVSRNAIYILGDMFTRLEKNMDLDLEQTTNALLKKTGESSSFIRDDVERALGCMVSSVAPSKAISALVSGGSSHRNVNVRKTAAQFLCMLAERLGPAKCLNGSKEITERMLVAAAAFASDGGAETRYYGRRILHTLDGHSDFERMLNKFLPSKSLNPTLTIIENLRSKGLGDPPSDVSSARTRKAPVTSGVGSRSSSNMSTDGAATSGAVSNVASPVSSTSRESSRRRPRRVSHDAISPQDQEEVGNLIEQLSSKDWKERIQAIDSMEEMIQKRLPLFAANIVKIMDGFSLRLADNNSKVNLHALQCLHRAIPILRDTLNTCVASIVPTIAKNLASKNVNIGNMAESVLDSFIKHLDNARLLQPLCQFIQMAPGGVQNRPYAVKKLLTIIKDVYPRKPSIVSKYALPVLWKLLESSSSASSGSGSIKEAVHALANLLYSLMGETLFEQAQAKSHRLRQKLKELLDE